PRLGALRERRGPLVRQSSLATLPRPDCTSKRTNANRNGAFSRPRNGQNSSPRVIPLAVDTRRSYADGTHPFRRDAVALPLLGLLDPPIRVGGPAHFVVGADRDRSCHASTAQATAPVVEIRRLG